MKEDRLNREVSLESALQNTEEHDFSRWADDWNRNDNDPEFALKSKTVFDAEQFLSGAVQRTGQNTEPEGSATHGHILTAVQFNQRNEGVTGVVSYVGPKVAQRDFEHSMRELARSTKVEVDFGERTKTEMEERG